MEQSNEQAETSSNVNVNEITTNNVLPKIKVCKLYLFNYILIVINKIFTFTIRQLQY